MTETSNPFIKKAFEDLNNKVKSLNEEVQRLRSEKDYLTKQVEHLQSCLDLEKNKD